MNREAKDRVNSLLQSCNVMSLATCEHDSPWAASVFFVSDETYRLYFISSETSRHSKNAAVNARAAATINNEHSDWLTICGLQVEGELSMTSLDKQDDILALYLKKFPSIEKLRDFPNNDQERLIAKKIVESRFYQLRPTTIRLIDNQMGFGSKFEMEFDSD